MALDNGNLCDYLYLFEEKSIYYNITFDKKECESIGNKIMTKGFRSAFVYFTESSVELITRYKGPRNLTRNERIAYI